MKKILFVAVGVVAAMVCSVGYADNEKDKKTVSPDSIQLYDTVATGPQL